MTTMLLGGLWHGAGWNYIVWGGLHGTGLAVNHIWRRFGITLPPVVAWTITFLFAMIAFLIFRAESAASINNLLLSTIGLGNYEKTSFVDFSGIKVAAMFGAFIFALGLPEPVELSQRAVWKNTHVAVALATLLVLIIVYLGGSLEQEFIYFQF
jgi:hypothetical protein